MSWFFKSEQEKQQEELEAKAAEAKKQKDLDDEVKKFLAKPAEEQMRILYLSLREVRQQIDEIEDDVDSVSTRAWIGLAT